MQRDRRDFMKKAAQCVAAGCILNQCPNLLKAGELKMTDTEMDMYVTAISQTPTYCGFTCKKNCSWLMASLNNDTEGMRKQADKWSKTNQKPTIPDGQTFCFGCKPIEKPKGYIVKVCDVRKCAVEKNMETCIACDNLASCDKDLWKRFPKFRKSLVEKQKML